MQPFSFVLVFRFCFTARTCRTLQAWASVQSAYSCHTLLCVFTTLHLFTLNFHFFPPSCTLRTLCTLVAGIKSSAVRARARAVEHRVKCKSVLRDVANNVPSVTRLEWAGRGVDDDTACAVADAIKCVRHNFSITFRLPLLFTLLLSSRHSIFLPFYF